MQPLQEFIDARLPANATQAGFSQQQLRELWQQLYPLDAAGAESSYQTVEDAFLAQLHPAVLAELAYKPGGWTIKVSESALKTGLVGALLTGVLISSGLGGIPALVIPAIVPLLFEVEKVRLSKSEQLILAELTWQAEARALTAAALYALLPTPIQDELSQLDFSDFLEKCRRAGLSEESESDPLALQPPDKRFSLRSPGQPRFRVTIL